MSFMPGDEIDESEASDRRAEASPAGLADEIEHLRERYGPADYAWIDLAERHLATILKALRSA